MQLAEAVRRHEFAPSSGVLIATIANTAARLHIAEPAADDEKRWIELSHARIFTAVCLGHELNEEGRVEASRDVLERAMRENERALIPPDFKRSQALFLMEGGPLCCPRGGRTSCDLFGFRRVDHFARVHLPVPRSRRYARAHQAGRSRARSSRRAQEGSPVILAKSFTQYWPAPFSGSHPFPGVGRAGACSAQGEPKP